MTIDATSSAEHLRQSLDQLNDPTQRPEIVVAYANTLNLFGHRRRESAELLRRTRERLGAQNSDLDERLTALLILACQFEPELYPVAAAQVRQHATRGRAATGLMLVIGSIEDAARQASRERERSISGEAQSRQSASRRRTVSTSSARWPRWQWQGRWTRQTRSSRG